MHYQVRATGTRPALIIYLIDASDTMREPFESGTRMDAVNHALQEMLRELIRRSMRDQIVSNRYHIAIFAYSTDIMDVLGSAPAVRSRGKSIWTLKELVQVGLPRIKAGGRTNTHDAFAAAKALLDEHVDEYADSPAPLVCHFTDGGFTTDDPAPVVKDLRKLAVKDGPVLVENVYMKQDVLRTPVTELSTWPGVVQASDLTDPYARFLLDLSSPLPDNHRKFINSRGYDLSENARLFFPGGQVDLIRLAFAASAATN